MAYTDASVAVGLRRTPLLSAGEMRLALDHNEAAHGIYAWWLINSEALPGVPATPHPSENAGLLYVGVGPGSASSKRKLRARFLDHMGDTGRSTLRRVLASLLYEREGWRPYWTDRPLLSDGDNDALTTWLTENLRVQWVQVAEPWAIEADVIRLMRPPLNRKHNQTHTFYAKTGEARSRFREAAKSNRR